MTAAVSTPAVHTGLSGLFNELETEALNVWEAVKAEGEAEVKYLVKELGPVVKSEAVVVFSQFKKIAIDTVKSLAEAEFASLTGGQKISITANTIFSAAIAAGTPMLIADAKQFAQMAFDAFAGTAPAI